MFHRDGGTFGGLGPPRRRRHDSSGLEQPGDQKHRPSSFLSGLLPVGTAPNREGSTESSVNQSPRFRTTRRCETALPTRPRRGTAGTGSFWCFGQQWWHGHVLVVVAALAANRMGTNDVLGGRSLVMVGRKVLGSSLVAGVLVRRRTVMAGPITFTGNVAERFQSADQPAVWSIIPAHDEMMPDHIAQPAWMTSSGVGLRLEYPGHPAGLQRRDRHHVRRRQHLRRRRQRRRQRHPGHPEPATDRRGWN